MSTAPEKYKHVMVDIETMGTGPDGAILAIGAVPFSLHCERLELAAEDEWLHIRCELQASLRAGRVVDADTIEWWLEQTKEAQAALLAEPRCHDLATFIYEFDAYLRDKRFAFEYIWAKPPEFDIVILRHAYAQLGIGWPFGGRGTRDVRTVLAQAKYNNREDVLGLEFDGEKHNAAHDAAHQARQVILAYRGTK